MKQSERTRALLLKHCAAYPDLQVQDLFKFLHQSAFGCEHFAPSLQQAAEGIATEYACMGGREAAPVEPLDGPYSRVPLSYMERGLGVQTFAKLFTASAKREEEGAARLRRMLCIAWELVRDGALPFEQRVFEAAFEAWEAEGYPALHHSEAFRRRYQPAYRVIANRYVPLLPLFSALDKLLGQGRVLLAIDGGSASGKTTLGSLLAELYDGTVFHMDDFFLRPEQRTPERFAELGGNVDRERFLAEVLQPLSRGERVCYRQFDCATMSLAQGEWVDPKPLVIVEGAYSMHPKLAGFYDVSVFLDIAPERQRERILHRNGPELARRFFDEWIPLEQAYFAGTDTKRRCGMTLCTDGI